MRTRLIVSAAMLLFSVAALGRAHHADAQGAGWQTVSGAGYSFVVPGDWYVGTLNDLGDGGRGIAAFAIDGSASLNSFAGPVAGVSDATAASASSAGLSALLKADASAGEYGYTTLAAAAPLRVSGATAASSSVGSYYDQYDAPYMRVSTVAASGNYIYGLIAKFSADYYSSYQNYVQYILGTLRIADRPAAPAPSVRAAAPTGHLVTVSGNGDGDSRSFALSGSAAFVCAQVSGTSPDGALGPLFSVDLHKGRTVETSPVDLDAGGCRTIYPIEGPGTYTVHVIGTPWTYWTVTVDPG